MSSSFKRSLWIIFAITCVLSVVFVFTMPMCSDAENRRAFAYAVAFSILDSWPETGTLRIDDLKEGLAESVGEAGWAVSWSDEDQFEGNMVAIAIPAGEEVAEVYLMRKPNQKAVVIQRGEFNQINSRAIRGHIERGEIVVIGFVYQL